MGNRTDDDAIVREMLTPDLEQSLEALRYWIGRRGRLPFYRRGARREADMMIASWQARTLAAIPRRPVEALLCGRPLLHVAGLALGYHARRFAAKAGTVAVGVAAVFTVLSVLALR